MAVNKKSILVAALLVLAIGMSAALVSAQENGTTATADSADGTATTTADGDSGAWGGHDGNCEDKDRATDGSTTEPGNSTATPTTDA